MGQLTLSMGPAKAEVRSYVQRALLNDWFKKGTVMDNFDSSLKSENESITGNLLIY
jgi:hypothetical protein